VSTEQMFVEVNSETLLLDCAGAAWWPAERTLIMADIHFEKGSSFAKRGTLLPPYDTRTTLNRIEALMCAYAPARVVALGDSFHDGEAATRLDEEDKVTLARQVARTDWIWIEGNHDPHPPAWLTRHGRSLRRRCFAGDASRMVMPAFGAYAGGLDVDDDAIAALFLADFAAYMLGGRRVYAVAARGTPQFVRRKTTDDSQPRMPAMRTAESP
jgi:metallophosphoesterase superfamily enzyme